MRDRSKRFAAFEQGLPDALDAMCRALRAGHPFNETLRLVAEEHKGPVAQEFGMTFADINYGNDVRRAMLGLLERLPRSEERRGGKEGVSTCRSRWAPVH